MQYLYQEGENYVFMDKDTYDQLPLSAEMLEGQTGYPAAEHRRPDQLPQRAPDRRPAAALGRAHRRRDRPEHQELDRHHVLQAGHDRDRDSSSRCRRSSRRREDQGQHRRRRVHRARIAPRLRRASLALRRGRSPPAPPVAGIGGVASAVARESARPSPRRAATAPSPSRSRSAASRALQTSTMSQPASSAARPRSTIPPATLAPSIDRSSLKTMPSNPSRPRRMSCSQTGENPAGRSNPPADRSRAPA